MAWPFVERIRKGVASGCHRKGLGFLRSNQVNRALLELERAVKLDPASAEYLKSLGNALKTAGRLADALKSYRRSLEIMPDYLPSLYNLGLMLRESGRAEEAEQRFRRVVELDPGDGDALFNLASLLAELHRYSDAETVYRRALEVAPDNPHLWFGLAVICQGGRDRIEESTRYLHRCIELKPDIADAHYALASRLYSLGRLADAVRSYEETLRLDPNRLDAHGDLGSIRLNEGRYADAEKHLRTATRLAPSSAVAHYNLGNVLLRQGFLDDAATHYLSAIKLQPDFSDARQGLGAIYARKGERGLAIDQYTKALNFHPDNAIARENLLHEMQQVCDWSRFEELTEQQRAGIREGLDQPVSPYSLLWLPSTPQEQLTCARTFAERRAMGVSDDRGRLRFSFEREPKARLRIGYLSADFREHPGAHLIAELVELHDRERFELVAYSYGPDDGSAIRERLKRAFDRFVDLSPLPHAEAASRIHADGIEILLDLTGYAMFCRPEILALRPAPIQVNFLGYPGTMGATFIDYMVTNRFMTPPEHAAHYSEQPVYMPGSHQANDRKRVVAETPPRSQLGLPEGAFVFCCLTQAVKITPDVFATWMRLLKALPGSIAWLVNSDPLAVANLRREAQRHGVAPDQLVFAPHVPIANHLARLRAADLYLDTFPYNAHSTAADALWVGLPLLTCVGDTFASRMAGSLLTAVGLTELITGSLEEYETLALRLGRDRQHLAALRSKLARNRDTTTLFDTPGYARHLETAFRQMWDNFAAGNPPRAIEL